MIIPHVKEAGGEVLCLFTNSESTEGFMRRMALRCLMKDDLNMAERA